MKKTAWVQNALPIIAAPLLSLTLAGAATADAGATAALDTEFCDSFVAIESTLSSSIPLAFLPPEVQVEVAAYQLGVVLPLFERVRQSATDDIAESVDIYAKATTTYLSMLDFSATTTVEYAMADDAIDEKLSSDCGFQAMPVTATNYEYLNIPETLPNGQTALTLTNVSDQVHEITVSRINDDVSLTAREILMLGPDDALAAVTLKAYAAAEPGTSETAFLDLPPGRYYAVCFTPTGSTSFHHYSDGAPHFLRGMLKEFTVEG